MRTREKARRNRRIRRLRIKKIREVGRKLIPYIGIVVPFLIMRLGYQLEEPQVNKVVYILEILAEILLA